jgi:hypothetical protein
MLSTQLYSLTVKQNRAIVIHGFRALRAGLWPQRSGSRPACLQTSYPSTLQRHFASPLFSTHLPPIVPVVAQREPSYPLSFHPFASYFLSNRGVHPLLHPKRPRRRARRLLRPRSGGKSHCSSISFISNLFRTLLRNGRLQSFSFQSLAASFHRHGGVYPLRFAISSPPLRRSLSETGDSTQSNVSSLILHGPQPGPPHRGSSVPRCLCGAPALPRILQETSASPFYSCACPRGFKHRRLS